MKDLVGNLEKKH